MFKKDEIMEHYLLAIDQGTTNSRAIIFNQRGEIISQHEIGLQQSFPHDGWVEQDPEEMFNNTVTCCRKAMKTAGVTASHIAAIGISNQRETTIIWDKQTGKHIYPAIVWQDRRTSDICNQIANSPIGHQIKHKTGLLLDPYFSATKIMWILDHVRDAREHAEHGELLFGTVDTYLLWKLTSGKAHATDVTNASRTLLFNIHTQEWDKDILSALNIPRQLLPSVHDNTAHFGQTDASLFGNAIPIAGMAGDQQAATIGQACFQPGMVKVTYGTGCFMLLNTGVSVIESHHHLLSTIAYRINNHVTYGLEGSIFSAGVTIKWLRDTLKIIESADQTARMAESVPDAGGVYLVPAFTGLGAPYWDPKARGAFLGLTRNSHREHIVRAALESVAYQTRDLLTSMQNDVGTNIAILRVDGGMSVNNWLMQFIGDILHSQVQRPNCIETTALGAAYLAGLQIGMYSSLDEISRQWQMNAEFKPSMSTDQRETLYHGWQQAVHRVLN